MPLKVLYTLMMPQSAMEMPQYLFCISAPRLCRSGMPVSDAAATCTRSFVPRKHSSRHSMAKAIKIEIVRIHALWSSPNSCTIGSVQAVMRMVPTGPITMRMTLIFSRSCWSRVISDASAP